MSIAEQTRRIYQEQHSRVAADGAAMARFIGMFTHDYFGLDRYFFERAKAVDVGCGNTGKLLIALSRLGCRDITGVELGDDFIAPTQAVLQRYGVLKASLLPGDVLDLPLEDESFDFVACHGVLVHLASMEEVRRGFSELARITKPGGYLYTVYGCVGGLVEDCIIPALRAYYRSNPDFRTLIDNVSPGDFAHLVRLSKEGLQRHEGATVDLDPLLALLDVDLCVYLQNIMQVPIRLACDEFIIREMYSDHGLTGVRRLRRYVKRSNIRRFFAPLHYEIDDPLVRLIYGSGNLEFIARKAPS
jgi:SAM-dependent methyltransferase